jgi:hypothetical protein
MRLSCGAYKRPSQLDATCNRVQSIDCRGGMPTANTAPYGSSLRKPHPEQVRALRRPIFGKGDTLLVACMGFGKSIIFFHAFSSDGQDHSSDHSFEQAFVMSNWTTFGSSNPCLITCENRGRGRDQLRRYLYSRTPRASSKAFRVLQLKLVLLRLINAIW